MSEEEKIVFSKSAFDAGACASFVKDEGRVAVDVRAEFSIDPATVRRQFASKSFIEFAEVSVGACLVQTTDPDTKEKRPPCAFLLTNAKLGNAVLREIGRRVSAELKCAVFLYASASVQMKALTDVKDVRFEAFSETMASWARRLFSEKDAA